MKILMRIVSFIAISLVAAIANAASVSPEQVAGATTVNAVEAKHLYDDGVKFIDVRRLDKRSQGRIPGSVEMDGMTEFSRMALEETLKASDSVVIYCDGVHCHRSFTASAMAVAWGYKKVFYFRSGFPAWQAAGFPVDK